MNDLEIVKEEKCVLESNIYIVYTLQDINSPIEMLDVTDLYNKNE